MGGTRGVWGAAAPQGKLGGSGGAAPPQYKMGSHPTISYKGSTPPILYTSFAGGWGPQIVKLNHRSFHSYQIPLRCREGGEGPKGERIVKSLGKGLAGSQMFTFAFPHREYMCDFTQVNDVQA